MAHHTAKLMTGAPVATFMVLQDFIAPELRDQQYVMGAKYTLRAGNTLLAGLMHEWLGLKRISVDVVDMHDELIKIVLEGPGDGDNS